MSAPLECNNWRPTCSSAAECIAQLAVCTLYCKLQPMCSLTGALALATCVTVEWWPGRHYAAPSHTDRWSQAPTLASPVSLSPLVLYPLCPDPCCSVHITHPPGECDLASLAAVSGWLGSSLLTCQYPLQQKVFSNGLHTAHHSHRHWIHSARRGLEISPSTRSPVPLSCSQQRVRG